MTSVTKPHCQQCFFIELNYATRAGSPQQCEPVTVGPYDLTHPVNFPFGRKLEYPEHPTIFGRALTCILFSHEDWVRVSSRNSY